MNYLNLNTKPHIIINKKIHTILFERTYCLPYNKLDVFKVRILTNLLTFTTKDYPLENEYNKEKTKRLIMNLSAEYRTRGDNLFFSFYLTVPKEGITESFNLDKAFELFVNSIFKPNVTNKAFDKKQFDREVSIMNSDLDESVNNFYNNVYEKCMKLYDDQEVLGISLLDYRHLLDELTPEDIYNYYLEIINSKAVNIIYGNTSKNRVIELYKKYNLYEESKFKIEKKYLTLLPKFTKLKESNDHSDYNQSCLFFGYKVKDYSLEENRYLNLIGELIDGRECRMLFNALRIDNQLVYHYSTGGTLYAGGFTIYVYLSKHNKDKAIEVINTTFEQLKNKDLLKENIKKVVKGYEYELIYELDRNNTPYRDYCAKLFQQLPGFKETKEFYENIDLDKFISFLNRIQLDTIVFIEGDKDA